MNKYLISLFILLTLFWGMGCSQEGSERSNGEAEHSKVYYTCSMHPHIREDKPGKCPICHMNLTKITVEDEADVKPSVLETATHETHTETHEDPQKQAYYYTCPMHPEIHEDKPGECPICGMELVKVALEEDMMHSSASMQDAKQKPEAVVARVKLRKAQLSHFRPDFFPVTKMKMRKKVRLLGSVLQSEEKESSIPARIGGRVEKVYVISTGSIVQIGDPVIDLYSPKLITAGEEYLLARKSYAKNRTTTFRDMLKQSSEKLRLWGIKPFQFEKWYKEGKVPRQITIYSNTTGIVQKRNATVGGYFNEGQNFFELSDLSVVWVEMDVYEHDASLVKIGQNVSLEFTALPGEVIMGVIDFINPVLDRASRTLKVRATIENSTGKLKPGMIAHAALNIEIEGMPLVVPRTAIIDTGKRKVVWTKVDNKTYQAKVVQTGYESEGYVAIKHGLEEGEDVVIEGNFLLDAQAQLFGGYEDMKANKGHNH